MDFSTLGIQDALCDALKTRGILIPTDVQAAVIPVALQNSSLTAEAETGSGKTLAYLLPCVQNLDPKNSNVQVIICVPTYELGSQIFRVLERLIADAKLPYRSALFLGGTSLVRQFDSIRTKPQIIVGTAGRMVELVRTGKLSIMHAKTLVLDEADRLFSKELSEFTYDIMEETQGKAKVMLFSATLEDSFLDKIEDNISDDKPTRVKITSNEVLSTNIEHWCIFAERRDKLALLRKLDNSLHFKSAMVFTKTSGDVLNTYLNLERNKLNPCALHGDFDRETRKNSMESFRNGESRFLITSDVGARGLDIADISHVIMLDAPDTHEAYVHRAGRTGRAGKTGVSIAISDAFELRAFSKIAVKLGVNFKVKKLHAGVLYDITLEEFFEQAAYSERKRKAHNANKRELEGSSGSRPNTGYTNRDEGRSFHEASERSEDRDNRDRKY